MRISDVYRLKCKKVFTVVFVVLFVGGLAVALGVGLSQREKGCFCDEENIYADECCYEHIEACLGECVCGRFPRTCQNKKYVLRSNSAVVATLTMGIIGLVGFIGTLVCLCVIFCCNNKSNSRVVEHELTQPQMLYGPPVARL